MIARRYFQIAVSLWLMSVLWAAAAFAQDIPRYTIRARVDDRKILQATQTVRFTNTSPHPVNELYFHIYPHRLFSDKEKDMMLRYGGYFKVNPYPDGFPEKNMEIAFVRSGEQDLSFVIEGEDQTLLKVTLPQPLAPGGTVEVAMEFRLRLPHAFGRLGWHDNVIKMSRWYPILAVFDEDGWHTSPFYPFHRPFFSEAAEYDVELTVGRDQVVAHSGQLIEEKNISEDQKTLVISSEHPIREFTAAMSPDYQILEGKMNGTTIKSYYLPGTESHAKAALQDATDLMKFYSQRFGAYPYESFSIVPVHLGYGGEQMSNLAFIDTRVYEMPGFLMRYLDFLVAHETGHQWFYNLVGVDEYTEMWLEEGLTSYFLQEYLENKYGADAEVIEYPQWFKGWEWTLPDLTFRKTRDYRYKMIARTGYDHPVIGELSSFQEPSGIFSITYGKGARILGMLRDLVGEEAFDRAFERIFKEYRFRNLALEDFETVFEEESGRTLDEFFDQWLKSDQAFDYAVAGVQGRAVVLENKGGIEMPVEVKVHYADGENESLTWDGKEKRGEIPLSREGKVTKVAIDPDGKLLDIDRTNNFWPRQLDVHPVPFYLGLYDMPIFMNEDAYNFVVGPEAANSGIGVKAALHKPFDQSLYAGSDYEFGESLHHTRVGYQLNNILHSQTTFGVEASNRNDLDGDEDDLASGKIFLRKELWPAQYNITEINDHATLYLLRNKSINDATDFFAGREDLRNVDYSRNEAITGVAVNLNRAGPSPDPVNGYRLETFFENAGHYLSATQYFYRSGFDMSVYEPVTNKIRLAGRLKYGFGYPNDKELYYIGGIDGLRGFERKSVRGANALLTGMELRFPLLEDLKLSMLDHLVGLQGIDGVFFYDGGQSWFSSFSNTSWKQDAGFGLRFKVNAGAMLEQLIIRADVATTLNEDDNDTRFWLGANHAF